jgi:hypothetical protein
MPKPDSSTAAMASGRAPLDPAMTEVVEERSRP